MIFLSVFFSSYCKYCFLLLKYGMFCAVACKIFQVLNFFFTLLARTKTFSLISKLLFNYFFLTAYFFLSYLSSLSDAFFDRSILSKLNSVLNLWLDRDFSSITFGFVLYFSLLTLFIFSADCLIIVTVGFLAFCLSDMALSYNILLFSSLIFCSAANAFPSLRLQVNIVC